MQFPIEIHINSKVILNRQEMYSIFNFQLSINFLFSYTRLSPSFCIKSFIIVHIFDIVWLNKPRFYFPSSPCSISQLARFYFPSSTRFYFPTPPVLFSRLTRSYFQWFLLSLWSFIPYVSLSSVEYISLWAEASDGKTKYNFSIYIL